MDFALVAPELPMPALPLVAGQAAEVNEEWMLNWLEVSPPPEVAEEVQTVPVAALIPAKSFAAPAPEWLFGIQADEPAPPSIDEPAPTALACTVLAEVVEFAPEPEEDIASETLEEEQAEPADASVMNSPVATAVPTTSNTAPAERVTEFRQSARLEEDSPRRKVAQVEEQHCTKPAPKDKGEVVWRTELVVAARAESTSLEPRVELASSDVEEQSPLERPRPEGKADQGNHSLSSENEDEGASDAHAPEPERKPATPTEERPESLERIAAGPRTPAKRDSSPEPRPIQPVAEFVSPKEIAVARTEPNAARVEPTVAVEPAAPAQRLRPTQVARVQVDIGNSGQAQGADPAMRLVVTQRGENVSVQLRSWNEAVAPVAAADVQPLLENLARHGLAHAPEGAIEGAAAIETPRERQLGLSQSAGSQQDAREFHGFDERQQRQQEQHRQQQEVVARRQRPGAEFSLKTALDEFQSR